MLIIHKEDCKRIKQALDNMRAAALRVCPTNMDEIRAAHTVTAGAAESLTILDGLRSADDHLQEIVDRIFAGQKCPLADDGR